MNAADIRPARSALKACLLGFFGGFLAPYAMYASQYGFTVGVFMAMIINGIVFSLLFFVVTFFWLLAKKRTLERSALKA